MTRKPLLRWLPALVLMAVIFAFSSTPSDNMPDYGFWDTLVKKGGHMSGYAMLALTYWYALGAQRSPRVLLLAWVLTVLYALSDEWHQSFVPGRHPALEDALGFDAGGAALALLFVFFWKGKRDVSNLPA